jgi:hypothetical protein
MGQFGSAIVPPSPHRGPASLTGCATPKIEMRRIQHAVTDQDVEAVPDNTGCLDESGRSGGGIPVSGNLGGVLLGMGGLQLGLA